MMIRSEISVLLTLILLICSLNSYSINYKGDNYHFNEIEKLQKKKNTLENREKILTHLQIIIDNSKDKENVNKAYLFYIKTSLETSKELFQQTQFKFMDLLTMGELNPKDLLSIENNLGYFYLSVNNPAKAMKSFNHCLEIQKKHSIPIDDYTLFSIEANKAEILIESGFTTEGISLAISSLEKLISKKSLKANAYIAPLSTVLSLAKSADSLGQYKVFLERYSEVSPFIKNEIEWILKEFPYYEKVEKNKYYAPILSLMTYGTLKVIEDKEDDADFKFSLIISAIEYILRAKIKNYHYDFWLNKVYEEAKRLNKTSEYLKYLKIWEKEYPFIEKDIKKIIKEIEKEK